MSDRGRSKALDLWISGGGTREPVDDVRYLGNRSTGRMALALGREAIRRGHSLRLLLAEGVVAPEECLGLRVQRFETAVDLARALESAPSPDAFLHAAAVADYAPKPALGKVPSGQESWTLVMVRQPKVVDAFRRRHPASHLTVFKLESGIDAEELSRRALATARRVGAQWVFANLLQDVGEDHHGGWLIPLSPHHAPLRLDGREHIAAGILDAVERDCFGTKARA